MQPHTQTRLGQISDDCSTDGIASTLSSEDSDDMLKVLDGIP